VAVIRDDLRPPLPADSTTLAHPDYLALIQSSWHRDPTIRPTFLEIMTRLGAMAGESISGVSSSSSGSGAEVVAAARIPRQVDASWTLPSGTYSHTYSSGSRSSHRSSSSAELDPAVAMCAGGVAPPSGQIAIVFSDITRAASLWEYQPEAMRVATILHNDLLRGLLAEHRGYEVTSSISGGGGGGDGGWERAGVTTSGEGSFCMAFQEPLDALAWCVEVQQELLRVDWPDALGEHPGAAEEWGDTDDRLIFRGLRVRMGIHFGEPRRVRDPMTRRIEYYGPVVNAAARITALTHGGQVRTTFI
jgi:class 3 adenylate cyclase